MSYALEFSEAVYDKLEDLGTSDAKRLRQVFLKILSLRRSPRPPDSEQLSRFTYRGLVEEKDSQGSDSRRSLPFLCGMLAFGHGLL